MQASTQDLAIRFKAVLDGVEAGRIRADEQRRARLAEGSAARSALLSDLADFAHTIGHLEVALATDLALCWGNQRVRFSPIGEGDRLMVTFEAANQEMPSPDAHVRIYRHPELADRWVLSVPRGAQEELEPLFDAGLVHLMTAGLGIPAPDGSGDRPQPDIDDLVASEG